MNRSYDTILYTTIIILSGLSGTVSGQSLYNNGAAITIKPGGKLNVTGDMINAANASLENNGALSIAGNITNNGILGAPAGSTLHFTGNTTQTINGLTAINAKNVVIDNAAGIILTTPLNIDGTITFTNGIIKATNSNAPVIFSSNGSVSGTPSDASHIEGYVRKNGTGIFTFPIGDSAKYQPVGLDLATNTAGITARYYAADAGNGLFSTTGSTATPLVAYNTKEYWDIVPVDAATGTITIYYDSYNNVGITHTSDLRVAHKMGTQWLNEGGNVAGDINSGTITSAPLASWSPFTLGSISNSSPLPVKLTRFSGYNNSTTNHIEWITGIEEPGTTFAVQRSTNAKDYETIVTQSGNGNYSHYHFYDNYPPAITYYRLLITTADGAADYSSVLILKTDLQTKTKVAVYPVPARESLNIKCNMESLEGTTAILKDVTGKTVHTAFLHSGTNNLNLAGLASGVYLLHLADGSVIKIAKQ
ncbi:MAG: T9SS type A sorting domain-containing protein [Taibaiella sp.]|nr:T9SS type A sorting domain-containing protein [Taibaiella sp.]